MRNMFVCPCSIKIPASGFDKLLESIFCLLLVVEIFSLQKVVKMLEEVVVSWQDVRWRWQMRRNFTAQFVQHPKHWSCGIWSRVAMEKNWALSVDQCQWQALQFLVHLIDLLSILLWCNGFARIQKTVEDQMSSRPLKRDHDLLLVQVWLWEVLGSFFLLQPLSWSLLVVV